MNIEELKTILRLIAAQRNWLETNKQELHHKEVKLHATSEWEYYETQRGEVAIAASRLSELETFAREAVVQYATETKEKNPINGISAADSKIVTILDEKKAMAWLNENAPDVLTINQSKFKKAVVNLSLDFVEIKETYSGRIASDLSEYLVTEDENENKEMDLSSGT